MKPHVCAFSRLGANDTGEKDSVDRTIDGSVVQYVCAALKGPEEDFNLDSDSRVGMGNGTGEDTDTIEANTLHRALHVRHAPLTPKNGQP